MAYIMETCIAGKVIEVRKYHDGMYGRRTGKRGRKKKLTTEAAEAVNKKNAEIKLRRKLNAGCEGGDYHITLTYKGKPPDQETARRNLKNFLGKLRRLYKKTGNKFMWLCVTEYESKRIHHHLILKQGPPLKEILGKWEHGRPKVVLMDDEGSYADLARYLLKETNKTFRDNDTANKKRWTCSRNWPEPKITKKVIKAERWMNTPKPKKGYMIEEEKTYSGIDEYGHPFLFYSMRKLC